MDALQHTNGKPGDLVARKHGWVAWALYGGVLTLFATAMLLSLIVQRSAPGAAPIGLESFLTIPPFATLGVLVARRRPEHSIGWSFLAIGLVGATSMVAGTSAGHRRAARQHEAC